MRRHSTAFLSAQPLNYLYWANIRGFNFLTEVCVLVADLDTRIIKSVVARAKFLISIALARVNCEKLMTRKYFTLLLFMFTLKLQPPNLKHPQIRLNNSQAKYVIKIPVFQTLKRVNRYRKSSLESSRGCKFCSPARNPAGRLSHHSPLLYRSQCPSSG
jgi:hypothetical protein